MDVRTSSRSTHHCCEEFQQSVFFDIIKYPTIYLSLSGIYVPHICARNVVTTTNNTQDATFFSSKNKEQNKCANVCVNIAGVKSNQLKLTAANNNDSDQRPINISASGDNKNKRRPRAIKPADKGSVKDSHNNNNDGRITARCHPKSWDTYFKIVFCCTYLMLELADISRLICLVPSTVSDENKLVYSLASLTFRLFILFLNSTSSFTNFNHFQSTCRAWLEYERKYGLKPERKIFRRREKIRILLAFLLNIGVFLAMLVGILVELEMLHFPLWPLESKTPFVKVIAAIIYSLIGFLGSCNTFSVQIIRGSLIRVLINEFQYLSSRVNEILSEPCRERRAEDEFGRFIQQMQLLKEVTQQSFLVVKHSIAAAYIFTPVLMCLAVYDMTGSHKGWNQNAMTVYIVLMVLVMILSTTILCAELRSAARSVWGAVYKVSWSNQPQPMLNKLSIFMNQLSVDDVSYSVYGMFTVDYSSLMMVGGTVLTYGILVLQLKLDKTP